MLPMRRVAVLGLFALVVVGCKPRFQGAEGFVSATTPVDYAKERAKPGSWKGDPYAYGGIADSTGGLRAKTNYGAGAREDAPEKIDPRQNQPAKGIGHNSGEFPANADPSYGNSNGPAAQPLPGAVGSAAGH